MPLTIRFLAVFVFLTGCQEAPVPPEPPPVELIFELIDETGSVVTERDFEGHLKLVFFGFTSCPDICPLTLHNVGAALREMGADAQDITVLFISIDAHRDTPERLTMYTDAFHPSVVGLTGTWDQLSAVAAIFRTTFGHSVTNDDGIERPLSRTEYESLPEDAHYSPYHSSQLFVLGDDGQLLDVIGYGSSPSQIASVVRRHVN